MNENALVTITQTLASPEMQAQLTTLLPAGVPVDRFTEVCAMAIRQSPEVLQADRQTLYDSCLQLARRGLLPDKKEAALVVFNTKNGDQWVKKVQALAMVEGIIKEMAKAGVKAYAVSVYANDEINLWNDDFGQHVRHVPKVFGDRGARMGCFAAAEAPGGRTYVEAMNMEDIAKVRARSKQKDKEGNPTGTWRSDPERMEQKSAMHRLRKRIPILDDQNALQNLKDFEEESDIELDPIPAADQLSLEKQQELRAQNKPPAEFNQTRRPRALQSVVDQASDIPRAQAFDVPGGTGPSSPGDHKQETADQYEGDDII